MRWSMSSDEAVSTAVTCAATCVFLAEEADIEGRVLYSGGRTASTRRHVAVAARNGSEDLQTTHFPLATGTRVG